MTVSVLVPTYRRCRLLMDRAIPSILAQTDPDWECHVIGDGTDQETTDAMTVLCAADHRFRYTNLPHMDYPLDDGNKWMVLAMDSLNHGLDTALGDFIAVLADDDEWTPDHNAVLLAALAETGADFAYGISQYHWRDGRDQTAGHWPPGMGAFCDGAYVYRNGMGYRYERACIDRGLPEDGDLWNRMVDAGVKFTFVPRVVLHYHLNRQ